MFSFIGANRQQQERDRYLSATVLESMEGQLIALYGEKEMLETTIGVSDAPGVIALVQAMEERVRRHEPDFDFLAETGGNRPPADAEHEAEANEAGDGLRDLSQRVRVLTGTVNSMEAQLVDVYADRELLYREAGIKQTQDVLVRMRENEKMREQICLMENQLAALFAQKHTLNEGLGVSDAREVVALVRGVSDALETAHRSVQQLLPMKTPPRRAAPGKRIRIKVLTETVSGGVAPVPEPQNAVLESETHA